MATSRSPTSRFQESLFVSFGEIGVEVPIAPTVFLGKELNFLATLFTIALSGQWVVGRVNYSELHQEGGLFFWKGLIRRLVPNARKS